MPRSIATVFEDKHLHSELYDINKGQEEKFIQKIKEQADHLENLHNNRSNDGQNDGGGGGQGPGSSSQQGLPLSDDPDNNTTINMGYKFRDALSEDIKFWQFGRGMWYDFTNRLPHYKSDWMDGLKDSRSIQKTISAAFFIYFACLLPSIAFGNLNASNTDNWLNVRKVLISQTIGGLFFSVFSTQPLVILITTAPIAI